jgi:hypothetical protein
VGILKETADEEFGILQTPEYSLARTIGHSVLTLP